MNYIHTFTLAISHIHTHVVYIVHVHVRIYIYTHTHTHTNMALYMQSQPPTLTHLQCVEAGAYVVVRLLTERHECGHGSPEPLPAADLLEPGGQTSRHRGGEVEHHGVLSQLSQAGGVPGGGGG